MMRRWIDGRYGGTNLLKFIDRHIDGGLEMPGSKLIRVANINQKDTVRILLYNLFKCRNVNRALFTTGLDLHRRCTVSLFPGRIAGSEHLNMGITQLNRPPGGFMTQLSGVTAAVKDERGIFVFRELALKFVEFSVRNADSGGHVALVIFGPLRPGIHEDHIGFAIELMFNVTCLNTHIGPWCFFPCWEAIGKNLDVLVSKLFRKNPAYS